MATKRDKRGRFTSNGNGSLPRFSTDNMPDQTAIQLFRMLQNAHRGVANAQYSRAYYMNGGGTDPRRNINHECGYPETENLTAKEYRDVYDREPIAARVVDIFPEESWSAVPVVSETEEPDDETAFEATWRSLPKQLTGDSKLESEEANPVWEALERVDRLSGVGRYGILLLGFGDGQPLHTPVEQRDGMPLLYLRVFDESLADIVSRESDEKNPRYGQPNMYSLAFEQGGTSRGGSGYHQIEAKQVHWSRVIHVVDGKESSEVYGMPRLQQNYNRIYDLTKLYGGSAEMYWQGAFPGISFETDPALAGQAPIDTDSMKAAIEQYFNGLQRYMMNNGMTAKSLAPQVEDPSNHINTQIEAICIELGIPKRIFTGSERGELASSQDAKAWNKRISKRQNGYLTPSVIAPFIDRLINVGTLAEPEKYNVVWPDLESLSDMDSAEVAEKRTLAMAKYTVGGVESIMTPFDYFTRELGMTEDEATEVVDNVNRYTADEEGDDGEITADSDMDPPEDN